MRRAALLVAAVLVFIFTTAEGCDENSQQVAHCKDGTTVYGKGAVDACVRSHGGLKKK